jgi:hypothetical protein
MIPEEGYPLYGRDNFHGLAISLRTLAAMRLKIPRDVLLYS